MSARARDWAWNQIRDNGAKISDATPVLLYLAERADDEGVCWPKIDTIAEWTARSRRTVIRQITVLCDMGLIEKEQRRREDGGSASNGYRLIVSAGETPGDNVTPPLCQSDTPPGVTHDTPPVSPMTPPRVSLVSPQEPSVEEPSLEPTTSDGQPVLFGAVNGSHTTRRQAYDYRTDPVFARFWSAYPKKVGKPAAFKAWQQALARGADPELIIVAAAAYRDAPNRTDRYTKHPQGWLNEERFNDSPAESSASYQDPRLTGRYDPARSGIEESLR